MQNLLGPRLNVLAGSLRRNAFIKHQADLKSPTMSENAVPASSNTAPASAVAKVLSTYELTENILKQPTLSTFDILRAQRVSKQWRDITIRSQELRQKLFLRPRGGIESINQALKTLKPTENANGITQQNDFEVHPILHMPYMRGLADGAWYRHIHPEVVIYLRESRGIQQSQAFVTQPPTKTVFLSTMTFAMQIKDSVGVTLGQIADAVLSGHGNEANIEYNREGISLIRSSGKTPVGEVHGIVEVRP